MKPKVGGLSLYALPGPKYSKTDWCRAVRNVHAKHPLSWRHSLNNETRFKSIKESFPVLYLAFDDNTALMEVQALRGNPNPAQVVAPGWTIARVTVQLDRVADLRTPGERAKVDTTVQELTGDWADYANRTGTSVVSSNPPAPTQKFGENLYRWTDCQGFLSPSSRNSMLPNLVVFPDRVTIDPRTLTIQS